MKHTHKASKEKCAKKRGGRKIHELKYGNGVAGV
jgi:hypothetical protein